MQNSDAKRISRLIAILTQLQTKSLLTATQLAERFGVSIRTIYRDIKALEQSGIPIFTEEGKGYSLMDGYRLQPVMFTSAETSALVTVEHLVVKSGDASLINAYKAAISKVKAGLQIPARTKMELLTERIVSSPMTRDVSPGVSLTLIQQALISFQIIELTYQSASQCEVTCRQVEPLALYYSLSENWLLIAFCRLRKDFRMFRLDRISKVSYSGITFKPHQLTLTQYLKKKEKFLIPLTIPCPKLPASLYLRIAIYH